ncbi:hypothetical protein Taro_027051 [Colocasia esculenta]|uniref:Uncharacterized protein n=1 Tax=Colocasia esculenta TaxID=4460 RepID=A0A843VMI1_COLES|nr:hypothetical protein [Colocasia esculenta]
MGKIDVDWMFLGEESKCVDTQADYVDTTGFNCSDCFLEQPSSVDTQVDCVDTTGNFKTHSTQQSRADSLGPSCRNGHLLLAPSSTITPPTRMGSHLPPRAPQGCRETTGEERARSRKKQKEEEEGKGGRGKWAPASVLNRRAPRRGGSARCDNEHVATATHSATPKAVKPRRLGNKNVSANLVASTLYAPNTQQGHSDG